MSRVRVAAELTLVNEFESQLSDGDQESLGRDVLMGLDDLDFGRFEEFDEAGLRGLAVRLVATKG